MLSMSVEVPGSEVASGVDAAAVIAVVAAVISLVAVAIAFWQARLARAQANAAKRQAEESTRQADAAVRQTELQEQVQRDAAQPYIWVDFRLDSTQGELINLVLRNEGPTVASDVRISFTPPLQTAGVAGRLDSVQQLLRDGFQSMPPGREMIWSFAIGHVLFAEGSDAPMRYSVTIKANGPQGEVPPLSYVLDIEEFRNVSAPRHGTLNEVAKAIRSLKAKDQ